MASDSPRIGARVYRAIPQGDGRAFQKEATMSDRNDWTSLRQREISRRTMLGASAKAGVGAAGLALVGCGDDDDAGRTAAVADERLLRRWRASGAS